MENFGKRALPHLIGLFAYSAILRLLDNLDKSSGGGMIIYLAIFIGIHVFITFVISIVKFFSQQSQVGKQYLLITFLVLIIGFGTCLGLFTLNIH